MRIYYNHNLIVLARANRNNMTLSEKAFWRIVKGKQIFGYDFHRQTPIGNSIADFFCNKLNLVVEIDGLIHKNPDIVLNDKLKDEYYASIGLNVLRFSDSDVLNNESKIITELTNYVKNFEKSNSIKRNS